MERSLKENCDILGVSPGASAQEVKQAYRDLAKVWHPDRFPDSARLRQRAEEKLKEINDAYESLKHGVPYQDFEPSAAEKPHTDSYNQYTPPPRRRRERDRAQQPDTDAYAQYSPPPQTHTSQPPADKQPNGGCAVAATTAAFLGCCFILPSLFGSSVRKMTDPGGWFTSATYETVWQTSWGQVVFWTAIVCVATYWVVRWKGGEGLFWFILGLAWLITKGMQR